MDKNPYADGKIRSYTDGIVRGSIIGAAAAGAWVLPYAWYWRVAIFVAFIFVLGMIYPTVQNAWAKRRR